ncbi:MAG TPA: hypothetical protein VFE06_13760 [Acidobacteriaceae bacterium]|nr:hypothetical protein [Acidobacteriaceae bacterium]
MDDIEHDPGGDLTQSHKALFLFMNPVPLGQRERVVENRLRYIEPNPMLRKVLPVLPVVELDRIPAPIRLQFMSSTYKCQYKWP